ncbi:MAG: metallophosphoesterase [Deltaproteobacteria bacterium]|nr:metallophosphoesterase [Candidatus Zymogenaceae bacterium]
MSRTSTVRRVLTIFIFLFFFITLFSLAYAAVAIVYGESKEDIKLPMFLGNKQDNIDLLMKTDTGPEPFSFFIVGDMQQGDFFPAIYRNDIKDDSPNFGVLLGDNVRPPKTESHNEFILDFSTWGIQEPVFVVCGNHDIVMKKDITENRSYSFTLKDFEKTYGPADFSFYYHGCLFVLLNDIETDSHVAYLADALSHRKKDTLMTFVFTHIPPHTISPAIKCREMLGEQKFLTLIKDYNVDYVISGDFHTYFRAKVGNTIFLISGGGMDKMGDNKQNRKGAYHAMLIQVDPLTKDVAERIYREEGQTRIGYTIKKSMLTQVFAFFEYQEKWEAPILSSGLLLSILLGVWGFTYVSGSGGKRRGKRT